MSTKDNTQLAFEKIHQLALRELQNESLPINTQKILEEIVALSRYQFDTENKAKD
ncbi:hypothetical protein [Stutzerimonas stutzeri]|uniref:hypothetical protein n=1 Tax=Stutzerimonas stutzeri TaxID=316 RepID=UPI00210A58FD|nr:hypothetical protein [Stutzerimonas stutzeri]MCQ4323226.1 hypothetical protein [Stutzerimonas stutzeri]